MNNISFSISKRKLKKGVSYRLRSVFNDENGDRKTKHIGTFKSKHDAIMERRRKEKELIEGNLALIDSENPRIDNFSEEYIENINTIKKLSKSQYEQLKLHRRDFLKYCNMHNIEFIKKTKQKDIEDFLVWYSKKGYKNRTYNLRLKFIKRIFKKAVELGFIFRSPAENIPLLSENDRVSTKPYEKDQIAKLIEYVKKHRPDFYPFLICAIFTGMRRAELCSLKWENIDLSDSKISLNASDTKSKYKRDIPIHPELKDVFLSLEKYPDDYVFRNSNGDPMLPNSVSHSFASIRKEAGLSMNLTIHGLRATFITHSLKTGNILAVQSIVGHKSLKTTQRYVEAFEEEKKSTIGNLSYDLGIT